MFKKLYVHLYVDFLDDPKIELLVAHRGFEGIGQFFALLSKMAKLVDEQGRVALFAIPSIAKKIGLDQEDLQILIDDCCSKYHDRGKPLLYKDQEFFWSTRLAEDMARISGVSEQRSAAATARWEKQRNATAYPPVPTNGHTGASTGGANSAYAIKELKEQTYDANAYAGASAPIPVQKPEHHGLYYARQADPQVIGLRGDEPTWRTLAEAQAIWNLWAKIPDRDPSPDEIASEYSRIQRQKAKKSPNQESRTPRTKHSIADLVPKPEKQPEFDLSPKDSF